MKGIDSAPEDERLDARKATRSMTLTRQRGTPRCVLDNALAKRRDSATRVSLLRRRSENTKNSWSKVGEAGENEKSLEPIEGNHRLYGENNEAANRQTRATELIRRIFHARRLRGRFRENEGTHRRVSFPFVPFLSSKCIHPRVTCSRETISKRKFHAV